MLGTFSKFKEKNILNEFVPFHLEGKAKLICTYSYTHWSRQEVPYACLYLPIFFASKLYIFSCLFYTVVSHDYYTTKTNLSDRWNSSKKLLRFSDKYFAKWLFIYSMYLMVFLLYIIHSKYLQLFFQNMYMTLGTIFFKYNCKINQHILLQSHVAVFAAFLTTDCL